MLFRSSMGVEVGREQAGVSIHHHHQRQPVEIVSLGQHASADIIAYQAEITGGDIDHPALAPASVARAVVAIRALHAFAFAEGLVTHNAAAEINPPSPGKRLPKGLSIDEVQRLLDAVDRDSWVGLRDAALLELLYGTGARIGEVVALDVDDLTRVLGDPEASLRLIGKGDRERLVPLGSYARAAVEAWLVRGRPVVLAGARQSSPALLLNTRGRRLSRQSAWAIMQYRARHRRSEERRVGKECRSRWSPYH